jgi:hypothetical protein
MSKVKIIPFNVVDHTDLPPITVDHVPVDGDPLEIDREMYYVCEMKSKGKEEFQEIGVIPLVVKNPSNVQNIKSYIDCLTIAHKRIQYRKNNNICDLNDCDEMIISPNQDIND